LDNAHLVVKKIFRDFISFSEKKCLVILKKSILKKGMN